MDSQSNRILITGATGCIGTALLNLICNSGKYAIVALSRTKQCIPFSTANEASFTLSEGSTLQHVLGDICDETLMRRLISNTDILIHLASKVHSIPSTQKEEEEFFRINSKASETIFNLATEYKLKKVVFLSTVAVYGKNNLHIASEDSICNPETAYSKSKFHAEEVLTALHNQKGLPMTIIRPVTVFGQGDRGNVQKLINLSKKGISFYISKGNNKKSFIYNKDVAQAILDVIHNEVSNGKVYNVKGFEISVKDLLKISCSILKIKPYTISIPQFIINLMILIGRHIEGLRKIATNLAVLSSNNVYSCEKLEREIGFKALYNFETGLKDSINYYLRR